MEYNGIKDRYIHNLQSDVIGIIDTSGNLVVEYGYDTWGVLNFIDGAMVATIGKLNPFRFRGYVWDEDDKEYYLRTRVYNPETVRFISEDGIIANTILGKNVFCYCWNCSANYADSSGLLTLSAIFTLGGAVIGAISGVAGSIIGDCIRGEKINVGKAAQEGIKGVIGGVFQNWVISSIVSFAVNTAAYVIECNNKDEPIEETVIMWDAVTTMALGPLSEGYGDAVSTVDKAVKTTYETVLNVGADIVNEGAKEDAAKQKEKSNSTVIDVSRKMPYLKTVYDPLLGKNERLFAIVKVVN